MNEFDFIIRSRRVVLPDAIRPASITIRGGIIDAVGSYADASADLPLVDARDAVVMPGLVDTHVHVNEPGRTEWEGFATATRAAAAGGVTTLVDMPLNSIPATVSVDAFEQKLAAARDKCWIDVAFWGGVVPGNADQLVPMLDAGVRGFKCFLVDSGVEEFGYVVESDLKKAMPVLSESGAVLLVHAETPGPISEALAYAEAGEPSRYETFLRSRPKEAENDAVRLMIRLCRETGARVHIVHHSSSDAIPDLKAGRDEGLPLTVETCPHYLIFTAEDVPDGATHFKCCPPVRDRDNREHLWAALEDGVIDMIVSDHSPCEPELKLGGEGDFVRAWGGIAGVQFGLSAVWTEASRRGFGIGDLSRWMSSEPAKLAGLEDRKGRLEKGCDADIVIWHPEAQVEVSPESIHHRHKVSPYSGLKLKGEVESTYLRGRRVYHKGAFSAEPFGGLLI